MPPQPGAAVRPNDAVGDEQADSAENGGRRADTAEWVGIPKQGHTEIPEPSAQHNPQPAAPLPERAHDKPGEEAAEKQVAEQVCQIRVHEQRGQGAPPLAMLDHPRSVASPVPRQFLVPRRAPTNAPRQERSQ